VPWLSIQSTSVCSDTVYSSVVKDPGHFFFQAEDGIRGFHVTGVQTCALPIFLGYTVGNDVSARDLQLSGPPGIGMDLFAAKSQDKTTGLGPWIVTKDEFPAGSPALRLTLKVNGETRQDSYTSEMTWNVGELISFVQQRSSFACGDVLFTGSPAGVGMGTGVYLNPGDVVEATVEGIGTLRNVVGEKPSV